MVSRESTQAAVKTSTWKRLKIEDGFLLGLSEPGFQDLECIDASDVTLLGPDLRSLVEQGDAQLKGERNQEGRAKTGAQKKKKRKRSKQEAGDQSKEELMAKIAALEHENHELRKEDMSPEVTKKKKRKKRVKPAQEASAAPRGENTDEKPDDQQLDMSAWEGYGLDSLVIDALARMGFTSPTPIQHECLPAAVQGNADIIGAAQTGSGKTLAFGLPMINYLVNEARERASHAAAASAACPAACTPKDDSLASARDKLRGLVICPTRELAMQVCAHLKALAKALSIGVVAIVGGVSPQKQARLLGYKPPIVVATPGRLWDVIRNGDPHAADLSYLSFLVIDEADRMVKQGNYEELAHILDHIPTPAKRTPCGGQGAPETSSERKDGGDTETVLKASLQVMLHTYVFSATLTLPDGMKAQLQRGKSGSRGSASGATLDSLMSSLCFRRKPKIADLTEERRIAQRVTEAYLPCSEKERDSLLAYILLSHSGRTLVFMNAISSVRRVSAILKLLGLPAQVLHAQQQQRQRFKALDRFKAEPHGVLIATDVAARGLDVQNIRCVVQYQLPPTADTYIHRAGRTARGEQDGVNISLVVPGEVARFRALHVALGQVQPAMFPVEATLLPAVETRVRLAERIDTLERVKRKHSADCDWMVKNAEAMDVLLDDATALEHTKADNGSLSDAQSDFARCAKMRAELAVLLAEPLHQRINSRFFTGGTAQEVAASISKHDCDANAGHASEQSQATAHQHIPAAAMNASVGTVAGIVELRAASCATPAGERGRNKSKAKQGRLTVAQHQAIALEKGLAAKHMKKSGKQRVVAVGTAVGRRQAGVDALAALRSKQ